LVVEFTVMVSNDPPQA